MTTSQPGQATARPPVSVVVPFAGTDLELRALIHRLGRLSRSAGDELIVADNRIAAGKATEVDDVVVLPAGGLRSPGFARNRGADRARGEWLVFIDADTEPERDLLDALFEPAPAEGTGILAGGIQDIPAASDLDATAVTDPVATAVTDPDAPAMSDRGAPAPTEAARLSATARHAVARGHMEDRMTLERPQFAYAQTANCAFRRAAFTEVGGFVEEARAGEDADLCFRLAEAGWQMERRPQAVVRHRARATLRGSLGQLVRHGSGAAWCNRRHPGSFPPPRPRALAGRMAAELRRAAAAAARGDREAAEFALLDLAEGAAFEFGRLISNRTRA